MGGSQSSIQGNRKTIEFEIFDKSFVLIEKYVKNNTKGLSQRFRREYQLANSEGRDGYLNWYNVFERHLNSNRRKGGMGYSEAIRICGQLLREAKNIGYRTDKKAFDEIYQLVDHLIALRGQELDPKLSFLGFVFWGGEKYDNHKNVVNVWKRFKN